MRLVPIDASGQVQLEGMALPAACAGVFEAAVALYARKGFVPPWVLYLAVEGGAVAGTCGFTGPPADGNAEIAYFTFPGGEGRGVATRMVQALIEASCLATQRTGARYIAHTLPAEGASTSILRKAGFVLRGPLQHPEDGEVWLWQRPAA